MTIHPLYHKNSLLVVQCIQDNSEILCDDLSFLSVMYKLDNIKVVHSLFSVLLFLFAQNPVSELAQLKVYIRRLILENKGTLEFH